MAVACLVLAADTVLRDAHAEEVLPDPIECDALAAYHERLEATARKTVRKSDLFRDRAETMEALRKEISDEARWKTSDTIVLAAVTKRAVDTIVHLTAMAADFDPALAELEWIPKLYDCAQAVVAAAKGDEPNYKDCVAAEVRRKKLKTGPVARWEAVKGGLKVMVEQVKSLREVVKTEQQRLEAKEIVETQLATIDRELAAAEESFAFEEGVLADLQNEANRVRVRLKQCRVIPARPPAGRRLRGRPPLANAIAVTPGAPLRALIAANVLSDPGHARAAATPASIADAHTVLDDAIDLRAGRLPSGVETNDVPALPDTGVGTELTESPAQRAMTDSAGELSRAVRVADEELERSIHSELVARLRESHVTAIDSVHVTELVDRLYAKADEALAPNVRAVINAKRVVQLEREGEALLREVVGAPDANALPRIDALASVIANTQGQFGSAFAQAREAAVKFQAAVRAVRVLTTKRTPSDLPELAGTVLVERVLGGTKPGAVSSPPPVFANPKTSLDEVGARIEQAIDVARSASDLAQLLPVPSGVKRAFAEASRVGAVASQVFKAAVSGNPLSAISALGSLFGGGPDAAGIETEHHEEVMRALGVLAAQQNQILELEKQIREDIRQLRTEVQAMQAAILKALNGIELRIEFDRTLIVSVVDTNVSLCLVAASQLKEYWQTRHRRFFVFDETDEKFFDGGIQSYLGQCARGVREQVEGSDPQMNHPIRPLFAAVAWEQSGHTVETLQKTLLPAAYALQDALRSSSSFDERVLRVPSRTWLEMKQKLASPPPGEAAQWYHQQNLLSPDYLDDFGSQLIAVLPLLEIAKETATGDAIRLCRRDDVVHGRCWRTQYARNALEAFARIVDVALYQQSLLAGDALLSAAVDALAANATVAPALITFVQSNPMLGRNLGLLLAFRGMERTMTASYRLAWHEPNPEMLQSLLHVKPIEGEAGKWHWRFESSGQHVDVPLPTPDEAELRIFELPTGVANLMRLRTQIAGELAGYDLATMYRDDGRALVDAIVQPAALPPPDVPDVHARLGCHGCSAGADGALGTAVVMLLVLRRRSRRRA